MSTFRLYFERFSGHFFSKFSLNKIVLGKKIFVPCLDVIMIANFSDKFQGGVPSPGLLKVIDNEKNAACEASSRQLNANFSCPQLSSFGPFRKLRKLLSCRRQIVVKKYIFDHRFF